MAKVFYTERDIDDLRSRGVTSLDVTDDVVITDAGAERAMKHGIKLKRVENRSSATGAFKPSANSAPPPNLMPARATVDPDLKEKIRSGVLARIHGQVDATLLDAVITRVLSGLQ